MSRGRIALAAAVPCAVAAIACGGGGRRAVAARVATPQTIATVAASTPSSRIDCRPRPRRFKTLPGLRPTGFCLVARAGAKLTSDLLLVTPRPDPRVNKSEQFGPMIVSTDGKLLWYERRPDKVHDLKVVQVDGRPALAFWQRGKGGAYQLLDEHYRPIAQVRERRG